MGVVALIDYGSGNIRSVENAVRAAAHAGAGQEVRVTADPTVVAAAERIVLPGVGAFAACMAGVEAQPGLKEALTEAAVARGAPFLGLCVGMQLLATRGLEFGETAGLGWVPGDVARLEPAPPAADEPRAKVPHVGWNDVRRRARTAHPLFAGSEGQAAYYFTHSYAFRPADPADAIASVNHGGRFAAAVARGNLAGVQFHPEKSQGAGLALIGRFLAWRP